MKNHTEKKPRGRPVKPETTALVMALIGRQDAMAERTAGKIAAILREHVRLEDVEIVWRRICRQARAELGAIPALAAARIPNLGAAGTTVLEEEIGAILTEMDGGPDDGSPLPPLAPEEKPPTVKRSTTLSAARAQVANLQTHLMTLRARIVRDYQPKSLVTRER
jgi:hypothetical protein